MTTYEESLSRIIAYFELPNPLPRTESNAPPHIIRNTTRRNFAAFLGHLQCRTGVEIGVQTGRFAKTLFEHNPTLHLYGIDPWESYTGYREHVTADKQDAMYDEARARLSEWTWSPIRAYSVDAVSQFTDNSLDFVYIDGNHDFFHTTQDLHLWTPKVRPGGIISGHDYSHRTKSETRSTIREVIHVQYVIDGWTRAHEIAPWFVFGAETARPGEKTESARSFMWIKR